jgi:hypothetical protein
MKRERSKTHHVDRADPTAIKSKIDQSSADQYGTLEVIKSKDPVSQMRQHNLSLGSSDRDINSQLSVCNLVAQRGKRELMSLK